MKILKFVLGREDTSLDIKTSTSVTNQNIALKRGVLESGRQYVLRLSAWKDGGGECKSILNNKLKVMQRRV